MRGLGNDFKTTPLGTFDIVYVEIWDFVLFHLKLLRAFKKEVDKPQLDKV